MASIKFIGNWYKEIQDGMQKGILAIKTDVKDYKKIGQFLNKLNEDQEKKNELRDLEIKFEYHYSKRTIDQNSLMWALYEIEANEHNAGMSGDKSQNVTSEELYENDLLEYAPRIDLNIDKTIANIAKAEYRIVSEKPNIKDESKIILTGIITTSKFNTIQMAQWIDRIFNRLACHGIEVTQPDQIQEYWQKWRQTLNNKNIFLNNNSDYLEYKKNNPICEACGTFIGENGQLAHIKSQGSGGTDHASNYLHLCSKCHLERQHIKGFDHFKKLYPHLSNKIDAALSDKSLKNDLLNTFDGEEIKEDD